MYQLPHEIVQLVVYYVGDDQDTLAALNRTNRALYNATLCTLYHAPSFTSVHQFRVFVENLSPKTASKVRKIDLKHLPHRWNAALSEHVMALLRKADNINYLDLCLCRINQRVSRLAIEKWPLQYLSLNSHRNVNDDLFASLPSNCLENLLEVDLGETNITDQSLMILADRCPKLNSLELEGCQHVTEVGIEYVTKKCQQSLKFLNIRDCFNVVPGPDNNLDGTHVVIDWAAWGFEDVIDDDDDDDDDNNNENA